MISQKKVKKEPTARTKINCRLIVRLTNSRSEYTSAGTSDKNPCL